MAKKNYISRGEHEIWQYIQDKEIVDSELVQEIFPEISRAKINKVLHGLWKKGHLKRAKKGLYYNPAELKSYYDLALKIRSGYIGLGSGLKIHGLLDYEDFTIFIITKATYKKIKLEGTNYEIHYIPLKKYFFGFEKKDGLYVSSLEKTLFDCLLKPKLVGYSSITKAFYEAKIDWAKLEVFFKTTKNHALFQRTGYILDLLKQKTGLKAPRSFLKFLLKKGRLPTKLGHGDTKSTFNKKWKIQDNIGEKNILSWWY